MNEYTINSDYPKNLAKEVLGDEWDENAIPSDLTATVEYLLLDGFKERDVDIMHYRFLYGMTYEEIGNIYSLSRTRINQRVKRAMRCLSHPSRRCYFKHGIRGMAEIKAQEAIEQYQREHPVIDPADDDSKLPMKDLSIEELDFSVRSYNALKRANYDTMSDIINGFKSDRIYVVRNLGRKSLEEVRNKLIALGIPGNELVYDADFEAAEKVKDCAFDERAKRAELRVMYGENNTKAAETILSCIQPGEYIQAILVKVGKDDDNQRYGATNSDGSYTITDRDLMMLMTTWNGNITKSRTQSPLETTPQGYDEGYNPDETELEKVYRMGVGEIGLSDACEVYLARHGISNVSKIIQTLQVEKDSIPPWHIREIQQVLLKKGLSRVELHM